MVNFFYGMGDEHFRAVGKFPYLKSSPTIGVGAYLLYIWRRVVPYFGAISPVLVKEETV